MWTYNSPNLINGEILCYNKNILWYMFDVTSLPRDYAVMGNIVAIQ